MATNGWRSEHLIKVKNVVKSKVRESYRLEIPLDRLISIKLSCEYFNIIKRMATGKNVSMHVKFLLGMC